MTSKPSLSEAAGRYDIKPTDIVIAVMGMTGVGKSTFISKVASHEKPGIGYSLDSCTQQVQPFRASLPGGQRLYLVDTPGFDDDTRDDTEILYDLSDWLRKADECKIKLTGIVYLHRITDNRLGHQAKKNLRMFKALCGEDGLKSVVLATTHWPEIPTWVEQEREEELQRDKNKWGEMMEHGSMVKRVDQDKQSVLDILWYLIELRRPVTMAIQKEMKDSELKDTAAGKVLRLDFEEQVQELKAKLDDMGRKLHQAFTQENKDREVWLNRQQADLEEKLAKMEKKWANDTKKKLEANADDIRRWREQDVKRREQEVKELAEDLNAKNLQIREAKEKLALTRIKKEHDSQLRDAEVKLKTEEVERLKLEAEKEKLQKEVRRLKNTLQATSSCAVM